jgi:hypothetical protein
MHFWLSYALTDVILLCHLEELEVLAKMATDNYFQLFYFNRFYFNRFDFQEVEYLELDSVDSI